MASISLLDPCRSRGERHHFSDLLGRCTIPDHNHCYRITVTIAWIKRFDNGHLISIGAICGEDGIPTVDKIRASKGVLSLERTTYAEWQHSGCQSSCKARGDAECRW